jgi:hypothetical protein
MNLVKAYQVQVKAYMKKVVPKHTKVFSTAEDANTYKAQLEDGVIWNVPVNIEVLSVYLVNDGDSNSNYLLHGDYIDLN